MQELILKGYKKENLKKYAPEDASYVVYTLPNTCYFCKYLTDIWWDYSNGPYMFLCEKSGSENDLTDKGLIGKCEYFESDEEI